VTILLRILSAVFLVFALTGRRWAYAAFMVSSLVYFPAQVGFHLTPHSCELLVPMSLALYSFHNYGHEILFTLFFVASVIHFSRSTDLLKVVLLKSVIGCLIYGAIIEIGEGISGHGHCRLRDLLPDSAGILAGMLVVLAWYAMRPRRIKT